MMGDDRGVSSPPSTKPEAPAPARRGMSGSAKSIITSMLVLLAGCLVLVALVPRVSSVRPTTANVASIARAVSLGQKWDVAVADKLPDGWTATNVTLIPGKPDTWQAGYTSPDTKYAAVLQTAGTSQAWTQQQISTSRQVGTVSIGGVTWTRWERTDGNQRSLVRPSELAGLSTVVIGTVSFNELDRFAAALQPLSTSSLGKKS